MNLKLGPILGHTTTSSTQIWISTNSALTTAPVKCHVATDNAFTQPVVGSPFAFTALQDNNQIGIARVTGLNPGLRYFYKISDANQTLGEAFYPFQTITSTAPDEFSFALVSCHAPFKYSGDEQTTMWRRLLQEFDNRTANNSPIAFLLSIGDQIYADEKDHFWEQSPWEKCLALDNADPQTPQTRQNLYRETYQRYWELNPLRQLFARYPQYMIWDDHDITNGWGSDFSHKNPSEQQTFAAAQAVYRQFQHSHNPMNPDDPNALYYGFHIGAAAFLVMDLRGERQSWANPPQLFSTAQRNWIQQFISQCQSTKTLFVVTSVPLFHLGPLWTWIPVSDVTDQWSDEHNKVERRLILKYLFDWLEASPERRVVILGGDVHIGTSSNATCNTSNRKIYQVTSSPISNQPAGVLDRIVRRVSGQFSIRDADDNTVDVDITHRFTQRNYAIINVSGLNSSTPKINCQLYDEGWSNATELNV